MNGNRFDIQTLARDNVLDQLGMLGRNERREQHRAALRDLARPPIDSHDMRTVESLTPPKPLA